MQIPKEILEKAKEGGFDFETFREPMNTPSGEQARLVLDPKFFQALGKALGWGEYDQPQVKVDITHPYDRSWQKTHILQEWLAMAIRYHELLLTGGDTEKFWKEILS